MLNQSIVLQFHRDANGVAQPFATLNMPANFSFTALTTDSSGQIYVGGSVPTSSTNYTWEVLVYAAAATGNDAPLRTIVGGTGSFQVVDAMTVDSMGQVYVVSNTPPATIAVMASTANGAAVPVRRLSWGSTQFNPSPLGSSLGIAVDLTGTIYVTSTVNLLAFPPGASGNVAPVRMISGSNTGFHGLFGVATDASGNVYVLDTLEVPGVSASSSIYEFPPSANGNVAPMRTIAGSNTGMDNTFTSYLQVDSTGTIYVTGDRGNTPYVAAFGPGASGNVAPVTTFTSPAWTEVGYYGIGLR